MVEFAQPSRRASSCWVRSRALRRCLTQRPNDNRVSIATSLPLSPRRCDSFCATICDSEALPRGFCLQYTRVLGSCQSYRQFFKEHSDVAEMEFDAYEEPSFSAHRKHGGVHPSSHRPFRPSIETWRSGRRDESCTGASTL